MSAKVTNEVWEHAPQSLTSDELLALVRLADYAQPDTRMAFPKVETIARDIHCHVRKTQIILRALVEKDCIAIYDRPGHGSVYYVQDLAQPHGWKDKVSWAGGKFTRRIYKPTVLKKRGAFSKKPIESLEIPTDGPNIPNDAPNITPIRPKRRTSHTARPTKYFSLEKRAQK